MKLNFKKEQYDAVIWILLVAAICLILLVGYVVWCSITEFQVDGTLVMAESSLRRWGTV